MEIENVDLSSLVEDPDNARTHSDRNISAIMDSLKAHGQVTPLVVQRRSGRVVAGNGTMQAMKLLNWREAKVVKLDIDDPKAREIGVVLNRTAELAGWDWTKLTETLKEIEGAVGGVLTDMHVGFNEKELRKLLDAPSAVPSDAGASEQLPPGLTYTVLVDFENENDQKALLVELEKRELKCRLMIS